MNRYRPCGMRLKVRAVEKGIASFHYDVGPEELEQLYTASEEVDVLEMGRYSEGGDAFGSEDHKRITEIMERYA